MCGTSKSVLGSKEVNLNIGYYGGALLVGDSEYGDCVGKGKITRRKMKNLLRKADKDDLIDMILGIVDNGFFLTSL